MAEIALVPVFTGTLQSQSVQLCDARSLHTFMEVRRDFSNWIKGRIRKFGFAANEDYLLAKSGENSEGRPSIEYHLSLDMAKELAMVENNTKGREARRYFIACEKRVIEQTTAIPYSVATGQTLSAEQAATLRGMLDDVCRTIPKDQQAAFMTKGWAKLKSHFGVSYRQIPAQEFTEAVSLVSRHIVSFNATKEPPEPTKLSPAMLVSLINGGCLAESAVRDIAMASTNYLFMGAARSPSGYGDEVRRRIDEKLPMADLHAIVVAATMEMQLRVHGYDIAQQGRA